MHVLSLVLCAFVMADNRSLTDSDLIAGFLQRVSAAAWPEALKKNPNLPERIERDKDGNLIRLRLDGMQLAPDDLDAIRQLTHLESLSLSYTNITDAQLKQIARLRRLKSLQLNHTSIGDDGVKALADAPKLEVLCLGGVKASRESVKALRQAKPKLSLGYFREGE